MQVHSMLTQTRPQDLLDFKYGDEDIVRSLLFFFFIAIFASKSKIRIEKRGS